MNIFNDLDYLNETDILDIQVGDKRYCKNNSSIKVNVLIVNGEFIYSNSETIKKHINTSLYDNNIINRKTPNCYVIYQQIDINENLLNNEKIYDNNISDNKIIDNKQLYDNKN